MTILINIYVYIYTYYMYMCMYVCMYVRMYVYMYMYIQVSLIKNFLKENMGDQWHTILIIKDTSLRPRSPRMCEKRDPSGTTGPEDNQDFQAFPFHRLVYLCVYL